MIRKNSLRSAYYLVTKENPAVLECYNSYLEKPLSHVAHELLHTEHEGWNMPI